MKCLSLSFLPILNLLVTTSGFTFPPISPILTSSGALRGKGLHSLSDEESTKLYPPSMEMSDMMLFDGHKALSHERDA